MPKSKNGQLTQGDRMTIELQLNDGARIPDIARRLGVASSTVTREIKRNSVDSSPSFLSVGTRNICLRKDVCRKHGICGNGCIMPCAACSKSLCNSVCTDFLPNQCQRLTKPPFVCNACHRRYGMGCGYEYRFYDGRLAHDKAQKRKVESREGIDLTAEELEAMRSFVKPLLEQGLSPEFIWSNFRELLPIGLSTFYHYIKIGVFADIAGPHLPRMVRIRPRKAKADEAPVPRHDLCGHTYSDFVELPVEFQMNAVEMDCVVGRRGDKPAILTLLFRRFNFQLMLYLPEKTQDEVCKALDLIEGLIGYSQFKKWFGVILTDRGSEFLDYEKLERSTAYKKPRCRVYYCDPMKSGQKGRCEKNHVELRRIIPKGTSFAALTPAKLSVICSHVNSYGRPQFGGASPFQLASQVLPMKLLDGLSIGYVEPENIVMKPTLVDL